MENQEVRITYQGCNLLESVPVSTRLKHWLSKLAYENCKYGRLLADKHIS